MIIFLDFMIFFAAIFMLLMIGTQIVLPCINGTPLFPYFRKSTPLKEEVKAAEKELEETTEIVALKTQLASINAQLSKLEKKDVNE